MDGKNYVTLAIRRESGRLVFINQSKLISDKCPENVKVLVNRWDPLSLTIASGEHSVGVQAVDMKCEVPDPRVLSMITGAPEEFRVGVGYTDPEFTPSSTSLALWLNFKNGAPRTYEILVGGI